MNINDLLHKRILVVKGDRGYSGGQTVEEVKVLEISPSGNWVKIQNMNGNKFWKSVSDITPIEVLASINTDKPEMSEEEKKARSESDNISDWFRGKFPAKPDNDK